MNNRSEQSEVTVFVFQAGMCTLFITVEDKVVSVACEHLDPVTPQKGDRVSMAH